MQEQTTGAKLLIHLLQEQGVQVLAGIPGGNILPFYDALKDSGLRHVLARSEQGAAFIAQGMARTTGRAAVCLATSGPGATNLLTGIADAWRDSIPVIAITGQVPRAHIGTQAFQEIDIISMAKHCTKACYRIGSADDLRYAIPEAFAIAQSGRPGPVWIDIPKDVFLEKTAFSNSEYCHPLPKGDRDSMRTANLDGENLEALLEASQRPLLYLGGGLQSKGASEALRALQKKCAIPAVGTLLSLGAISTVNPLWYGMIGMHGAPSANMALDGCDLLIVAGARFGDRATGALSHFAPQAKVIHLDCDAKEFGRLRSPACALQGELWETLALLTQHAPERKYPAWLAQLDELRAQFPMPKQFAHDLIQQIADIANPQCFVVTDVGQHQMWTAQAWPLHRSRQWLTSGGLGTMGFGLPAAIGASLANPNSQVICISGDGSILMNLQELATLADAGGNVKICVFDNGGLGMVRQQQNLILGKRYFASDFESKTDLCAIARAFGIQATDAERDPNWKALLEAEGPALIRFAIPAEEIVWPMVPGGKANREMLMPADA